MKCCKETKEKNGESEPIDQGWAWVIAFACAGLNAIHAGTMACFGIIKLEMMRANPDESSCSQQNTLWILSIATSVMLIMGTAVSMILWRTTHRLVGICGGFLCLLGLLLTAFAPNCHMMFFSFSFIFAAGAGALDLVAVTVFAPYFLRHRALAIGIIGAGAGVGGIICPQIITYLFDTFSFRDALILYSGLYANTLVLSSLLRPLQYFKRHSKRTKKHLVKSKVERKSFHEIPELQMVELAVSIESNSNHCNSTPTDGQIVPLQTDCNSEKVNSSDKTNGEGLSEISLTAPEKPAQKNSYNWALWLNPKAIMFALLVFFSQNARGLVLSTTPSYAKETDISSQAVATIISSCMACQIVTRIAIGWFVDRKLIPAKILLTVILLLCCVAMVIAATNPGLAGIITVYVTMGVVGTCTVSIAPIVMIELLGVDNLEAMTGINCIFEGTAGITSAVIANGLYKEYESWSAVFYFIAACFMVSALISAGLYIFCEVYKKKAKYTVRREPHKFLKCIN